jgi:TetR/AcrR family transcriptional repressor of nem operon
MGQKADQTRLLILEKTSALINQKGIAGTTLSDIMEATQLTKGCIYGHFESKGEICLESFVYLSNKIAGQLHHAINKGKSAKQKLYNFLDYFVTKDPSEGGCPLLNFGLEVEQSYPMIRKKVQQEIHQVQKLIGSIIIGGIADEELSTTLDPKIFSIKVFTLIEGALLARKILESNLQMVIVIKSIKSEFDYYLN